MPWSLSQYGLYQKCLSAYKFRHVERLPDPAGPAASRGTAIHAQLEGYLKTGSWDTQIPEFTLKKAEVMWAKNYKPEVKLAFNDKWEPVDWQDSTAWVRAVIDSMAFLGNAVYMGEWKTGKVYENHADQRHLYMTMALAHHTESEVAHIETIYVDQDHAQADEMPREKLEESKVMWLERVGPMLRDTFYSPRPGQHCRWCNYSKLKGGPCHVA